MNTPLQEARADVTGSAPALMATRPMYWCLRREVWENRSIYIAPLAAGALGLVGFLISLHGLPRSIRALPGLDTDRQLIALATPYSHVAMLLMLIGLLVGFFYSLDALHGERRDRSILFWKSLPVSDVTTVLSKAIVPLVILPSIVFAITVVVQITMRVWGTIVLFLSGVSAAPLWTVMPLFEMELVLLYGLVVIALWYAPIYCWFLLTSGWARRAPFLWAVLPPLAIGVFETIAFHTSYFGLLMKDRLLGFAPAAFELTWPDGTPLNPHFIPLTQLTPGRFLTSVGLWVGLAIAAACLAAAVKLRHSREPI